MVPLSVLVLFFFFLSELRIYFTAQKSMKGFYGRSSKVQFPNYNLAVKYTVGFFSFLLPGNKFWPCQLNSPKRRRKKERNDCSVNLRRIMKLYSLRRILGSFILPSSAHIYVICLSAWNELSYVLDREKYLYWLRYLRNLVWMWLDETEKRVASCTED